MTQTGRTIRSWLIVRADGSIRVFNKPPGSRLHLDEIAVPVVVHVPAAWGKCRAEGISIQMPEPPEIEESEPS
jgi:hypothetical protein